MKKIDYIFLDGGHTYQTVMNDLEACIDAINNGATILCDDYNLGHAPGVKKSIDDFVNNYKLNCNIIGEDSRFAKIEK